MVIFFIYLGQIARFAESDFGGSGSVEAGNVLSFGATVGKFMPICKYFHELMRSSAGFALGWTR